MIKAWACLAVAAFALGLLFRVIESNDGNPSDH